MRLSRFSIWYHCAFVFLWILIFQCCRSPVLIIAIMLDQWHLNDKIAKVIKRARELGLLTPKIDNYLMAVFSYMHKLFFSSIRRWFSFSVTMSHLHYVCCMCAMGYQQHRRIKWRKEVKRSVKPAESIDDCRFACEILIWNSLWSKLFTLNVGRQKNADAIAKHWLLLVYSCLNVC